MKRLTDHFCYVSIVTLLLFATMGNASADKASWLQVESGEIKIYKLFGLPEGERFTITIYPPMYYKPELPSQVFREEIFRDTRMFAGIIHDYETTKMEYKGIEVLSTLKSYRDEYARKYLVHYQAFFFNDRNLVWFVRADLSDNLNLLKRYYDDLLAISLAEINY